MNLQQVYVEGRSFVNQEIESIKRMHFSKRIKKILIRQVLNNHRFQPAEKRRTYFKF